MTTFDPHAERPWSSEEDKQLRKAVCQGMHAISFSHPSYFIFRFFSPIRFSGVEGGGGMIPIPVDWQQLVRDKTWGGMFTCVRVRVVREKEGEKKDKKKERVRAWEEGR